MQIRFLGCHHTETAKTRLSSLLVDQVLAVDAGAITSTLTSQEQAQIQAVLITHRHYDHVRDLPTLALGGYETGVTLPVFSTPETLEFLHLHLLDNTLYPNFTQIPTPQQPRLRLVPLEPRKEVEVCGTKVTPIPVVHSVPAVGYRITSPQGRSFFYTGDTDGQGLMEIWEAIKPDLVIVEVTFPDSQESVARQTYHMTPGILERELQKLLKVCGASPPLIAVHMNAQVEEEIIGELKALAAKLGISITPGYEGMVVEV